MTATRRIALLLAFLCTSAVYASSMPVPVTVQLPLFTKIWKLDRTFPASTEVVIAIIYQESHGPSAIVKAQVERWVATSGQRIRCVAIAIDDTASITVALNTVAADIFYITPLRGADVGEIARIARARHIKTNTGVPEYVDAGLSVAIDVRNDRPLIVINLAASRAEGSSFPAQLLELARLVDVPR